MSKDLQEKARSTMAYFIDYYIYPLVLLQQAYQIEMLGYTDEQWDAPRRAARLSAAVKNYKTSQMLLFIISIGVEEGVDLTPLVVKRLCNNLFGRKGSQSLIVKVFGEKNRIKRSAHSDPEEIELITKKYQRTASQYWSSTLSDIEEVKLKYKDSVLRKRKRTRTLALTD